MNSFARINIPRHRIATFCKRWRIAELALFGSVVRQDFGPRSDVDILVTFHPSARPTLLDMARIENELSALLGRRADLVERRTVERSRNYLRKEAILRSARIVYAGR
ncbi:nucleotidyltransferase family protein [Candidatus Palauibacter sp.]|uniref:nucleotidyltransferase family protein n=1 Tax=Candidatus Palauibacter sp. TaxID=3101350 RepID=UPI003B5C1CFD